MKYLNCFFYLTLKNFIPILLFILYGCAGTERFNNDEASGNSSLEVIHGVASYYSDEFHGKKTANGETYNMYELTAAHKTYPFNTKVRVTNSANGKSVVLRINDRMPPYNKRIIDVSFQAAKNLGMIISGIADVKLEVLKWGD